MQWSLRPALYSRCLLRQAQPCNHLSLYERAENIEDRSGRLLPRVPEYLRRQRIARLDRVRQWLMLRAYSEARLRNDTFWSVLQRSRAVRPVLRVRSSAFVFEAIVQKSN